MSFLRGMHFIDNDTHCCPWQDIAHSNFPLFSPRGIFAVFQQGNQPVHIKRNPAGADKGYHCCLVQRKRAGAYRRHEYHGSMCEGRRESMASEGQWRSISIVSTSSLSVSKYNNLSCAICGDLARKFDRERSRNWTWVSSISRIGAVIASRML